jgi:glucose/arabinose dehydrogenase
MNMDSKCRVMADTRTLKGCQNVLTASLVAVLSFSLVAADKAADTKEKKEKKPKVTLPAKHDPADLPFRRAPMTNAVRSVIVPLSTNLHLAFDTELLRTHTVWQGESMNLWGTPFHGGKDHFYGTFDGPTVFTMPPVFPWAVGKLPDRLVTKLPEGARFKGISTKGGGTTFLYELPGGVAVSEAVHGQAGGEGAKVTRTLTIGPAKQDVYWLVLMEQGNLMTPAGGNSVMLSRGTNVVMAGVRDPKGTAWETRRRKLDGEFPVWTEVKNDSEIKRVRITGEYSCTYLKVPAHAAEISLEVVTMVVPDLAKSSGLKDSANAKATVAASTPPVFGADKSVFTFPSADEFFRVEHFPLPKEIELRVNGMDFLPNGDLAVCVWTGEIYIVQKPQGDVKAATYRRFARGLCEPCGLRVINGQIYVVQKQELTRLTDTDGNGEADLFECITQDWGYTGNYHDFSYGPLTDKQGNFYVYRTGNRGIYEVPYMGWALKISPDGRKVEPFASGFRSPNGFAEFGPERDLFMADNQGNWIGACTLTHVQKGRFYGFPSTTPSPKEDYNGRSSFDPPAVWFPYSMAKSSSGMVEITDDRFGPFKGQMLVGDFQNAVVTRVALEKVNGEYQGAVWPFSKGYWSGVNRLAFGPDGKLYVGGLKNVAWAAVAPKDWSLERVAFTGKTPFEVKSVHARPDGFELVFTQPVEASAAGNVENFDVSQYRYEYHQAYGSPEFDHDGKKDSATSIKVASAKVSADGLKVHLKLEGWKAGYVTTVRSLDIKSAEGKPLWHDTFYYTLNSIPKN